MIRPPALAAALLALAAFTLAACQKSSADAASADDMTLGNPKAPVTVIEYASLSCPHCAAFNNDVFPSFKAKYIDTGRINYVFREALTADPAIAAAGFLTARCAGKDKYFQVVDAIFHVPALHEGAQGDPHAILLQIAESAGLSEAKFNACIRDPAAQKALNDRWQGYVTNNQIEQTPTFVINGVTSKGDMTLAQLDAAIAKAGKPAT
ncbi:MAG TPA: thioredoxin domain-containing protein [Caulobacteraceae bacterium]|jgi:protein-disulfide isomerase